MRRPQRILTAALSLGLLSSLTAALPNRTAASPTRDDANTITIMTCCGAWAGFNKANIAGVGIPYIGYYKELWKKKFPNLKIKELDVSDAEIDTKIILGVNAGSPPDIVTIHSEIGELAARHALTNLDPFYQRDGVTASTFLTAMASWAQVRGHWYGIPAASGPSAGQILYIPKFVKDAGWDPNNIPRTWADLFTATQKVTTRDSKGNLQRIGEWVDGASNEAINLFCGYFATYEPKTTKFHVNSPCIKDYFRYEKKLLDFYGGVDKYTKFKSGDAGIWGGYTTKAYIPTGKVIFPRDAYWSGQQMDGYWNLDWRLAPPPTPHGKPEERVGNTSVTQWQVAIPMGAKHAQLAFEFAKFTLWDNGYVQGPTTNGFTVANQADKWAQVVVKAAADVRASKHFPGNPMSEAVKLVMSDARLSQAFAPTDVAAPYVGQQLSRAWQQIVYGRASVVQALDQAQRLIDTKQRILHAQYGM